MESNPNRELGALVVSILLLPVMLIGGAWLDCWTARKVWTWFLAATFGPFPGTAVFLGVWFLAQVLTHQSIPRPTRSAFEALCESIAWVFLRPPLTVATAWLIWMVLA